MASKEFVCTACGYRGQKQGYGCMEVVCLLFLMLFLILPGIIYAIWVDSRSKKCPNCGAGPMIPTDSPRGQEIIRK